MTITDDELDALAEAVGRMTQHAPLPWSAERGERRDEVYDSATLIVVETFGVGMSTGIAALANSADRLISAARERNAMRVRVGELEAALGEALKRWSLFNVGEYERNAYDRARALLEKKP